MIQKKICLMGAFATGKTSLLGRFVSNLFSEKYLTTVGVRVEKKIVMLEGLETSLILWDLHGEDEFQQMRTSYLRGASGYIVVVDGTRSFTLDTAIEMQKQAEEYLGPVPFLLALNKTDLKNDWEVDPGTLQALTAENWKIVETSAKTGAGVDEMFELLTRRIALEKGHAS